MNKRYIILFPMLILVCLTVLARKNKKFDAYLFAYFEGTGDRQTQEQLRFAVSPDVIRWQALNQNKPIIPSAEISNTGGIRDPHILRGEDNSFYIVATDMYVMKNGWGHNPGLVLMHSRDLLTWTHAAIDLEKLYPEKFSNVQWVWAPQTIYDPQAKKYLVYFTVKFKNDPKLDFYCAYASNDFKSFAETPHLMFSPKFGAIDGDIIYRNGVYHMFFKGNTKDENGKELKNGIQQATATSLQGSWTEDFKYLDIYAGTSTSVEGSSIVKLNDSDSYILMYDLYRNKRYEFQRSNDLYNFTNTTESFEKDFYPRHGSIIGITKKENARLNKKWGNNNK